MAAREAAEALGASEIVARFNAKRRNNVFE
jgi:hypothetical protein